jgi:hypothetical protein
MDFRSPAEIQAAGGIMSHNPNGDGSVIDHVYKKLGNQDPWVSTTSDKKFAQAGAQSPGDVYVYYIEPSGLYIVDTAKAFIKANLEHPHPVEKEFSVKGSVPWNNIVQWDKYTMSKKAETTTREEYEKNAWGSSPKKNSGRSSPKSNSGGSSPKKSGKGRSIRSFTA